MCSPPESFLTKSFIGDLSYHPPASQVGGLAHTFVTGRKTWKTLKSTKNEAVWPVHIEAALFDALEKYRPSSSGDPRLLRRFPKRNRFISDHIFKMTGKVRTPKQVGSRLQQLRDTCQEERVLHLLSRRDFPPIPEDSSCSSCPSDTYPPDSSRSPDTPTAYQSDSTGSPVTPAISFPAPAYFDFDLSVAAPPDIVQTQSSCAQRMVFFDPSPLDLPPQSPIAPGNSWSTQYGIAMPQPVVSAPQVDFMQLNNNANGCYQTEQVPWISVAPEVTGTLQNQHLSAAYYQTPTYWR